MCFVQGEEEPLQDFMRRFNNERLESENINVIIAIVAFTNRIRDLRL